MDMERRASPSRSSQAGGQGARNDDVVKTMDERLSPLDRVQGEKAERNGGGG